MGNKQGNKSMIYRDKDRDLLKNRDGRQFSRWWCR